MSNRDTRDANIIHSYMHCRKCVMTKPKDQSMEEWARINVGYTNHGIQVWCVRHKMNIITIKLADENILPPTCDCKEEHHHE